MSIHADAIRLHLARGAMTARHLAEKMQLSQPSISRALRDLGADVVRIGRAQSIQYALRDSRRALPVLSVMRVDAEGRLLRLGTLVPVCPDGFVMQQADGAAAHYDGLPWWLCDMRAQGFLGRAYAARHGQALGLPVRLGDWHDTHILRALLAHGHDVVGNLLLGEDARERFLAAPVPEPIGADHKGENYARLAQAAVQGDLPGSSAGGEQPKFAAYAHTAAGPRHVLVKFSEPEPSPVSERWRDLLLAEHLALATLRDAGVAAAATHVIDHRGQRFLEVERFDRVAALGRRGLLSLAVLDAEFVDAAPQPWPVVAQALVAQGVLLPEAAEGAALLWAFGALIGNTDMHGGNLSFLSDHGRPYALAPAYDMSPMAFAPRSGGGLPAHLHEAVLHGSVSNALWRRAEVLARQYLARLASQAACFSPRFQPCLAVLAAHVERAGQAVVRLG